MMLSHSTLNPFLFNFASTILSSPITLKMVCNVFRRLELILCISKNKTELS